MLKSTYTPNPLPPGWTEHKAPTGHTYYYNAETKQSTYTRPVIAAVAPPAPPPINLSDPSIANAFLSHNAAPQSLPPTHNQQPRFQQRPRPQPVDKPRSKVPIPGCEPWILVYTKYGRRFAYNPTKNASYWRIPEKIMPGVLELDKRRILEKAGGAPQKEEAPAPKQEGGEKEHDYDSSEYEEVEVTDSEDESAPKRQRTEEHSGPVEFTEADIAAQLAAMGGGYDDSDEEMQEYEGEEEEEEEEPLSEEEARQLFFDLLDDFNINPYSSWEKLIEEGKIIPDSRYTVLPTTKARKEVWAEWQRAKIAVLKARRATEEKKDPRIPYLAFLQEHATPKLYWPEFRRKYKKEGPMKDPKLSDKDREKYYREHINRLKLPQATLKSDLKKLLEGVPLKSLNNTTNVSDLPPQVVSDVRYISLDPKIRDPFVEAYVQGLGPPPEDGEEDDEAAKKAREERRKREKALQDRERAVAEEKRKLEKKVQFERARLREEERELERAMQVGKKGLQSQLAAGKVEGGEGE
ncbi:hypothetical protein OQA88_2485 [Cercophora sp. LCS_1]